MVKPIRNWLNHSSLALCAAALCACAGPREGEKAPQGSELEQKLAQNPDDAEVNFKLAENSQAAGDLLRAEQYYRRAEALGVPADRVVPRIIRVLAEAGRYQEAIERCRRRLELKPGDRATRYVEAALLVATDRPKEAERELDTLVREKPDDADAYLALGKLYRDDYRDRPRARAMFEKYLQLAPTGEQAAAVRFELAEDEVRQNAAPAEVRQNAAPAEVRQNAAPAEVRQNAAGPQELK